MPLASMVTGAAVTAALGDQIADNVVALYEGWWFRATTSVDVSIGAGVTTLVTMNTLALSATATDDGSITLNAGSVQTTKPGLWMVGGHIALTAVTGGTLITILDSTDAPGGVFLASTINDTGSNKDGASVSIITEVLTTPNTFGLSVFNTSSCIADNIAATALWGVFMGDNP
jgi:hypothetical protein